MPKKPLRHNSSNLGELAKSSYTASVHSSKPRSSRDLASLMGNSRDGPYTRPSLKSNCYLKGSWAAVEPDHDANKVQGQRSKAMKAIKVSDKS